MAGIQFHRTRNLAAVTDFYRDVLGMDVWLRQEDCVILKHENLLLGFCQREQEDTSGTLTFFYRTRTEVDRLFRKMGERVQAPPGDNERDHIYHFFARDPEGRTLEFQHFEHATEPSVDGEHLLLTRRSVRTFTEDPVSDETLWKVFETCRYSPTSRNSESYSFIVVRNRKKLAWLSEVRGMNSAPIGRALVAVAVVSDPTRSQRHVQDGCIAAYHFLLSAWLFGLGTCWIAAMDRDDVKEALEIPRDYYVATVTPLGYPAETPYPPRRRSKEQMVRFLV